MSSDASIRAGFEPAWFWERAPGRAAWASMLDKYEALGHTAQLAAGPRDHGYKRALVELSSRWPGALREGELIGPAHVQARARAAARGLAQPQLERSAWTDAPARAVLCWAQLHLMIRDVLEFRRREGRGRERGGIESFAAWVGLGGGERAQRWPNAARMPELLGAKLEVRSAYLWLAARMGASLPELNALLLARSGHWDRRPSDPAWAHTDA